MTAPVALAADEGITPRMGGEAWVEGVRALAGRPLLTGAFIVLMALMLWLELALGGDDGTLGLLAGDLAPSVAELFLVATLMVAVHRAVILGEVRSPPPWQAVRTHLVFMGWLVAFDVLDDGLAELMGRAGTTGPGLLAHAGLFLAGVYVAARLALLLPAIALTGSGGWLLLRGAWGLSRGRVFMMVLTAVVTGAPLLGGAVLLMVFDTSVPATWLLPPVTLLMEAAVLAVVLAVSAALASLLFLACSRLQELPPPAVS